MKVLVTGGAGFIGSHLVEALLRAHYQVFVIDDLSSGKRSQVPAPARFYKIDIRSPKLQQLLMRLKPDYVCHLAAQKSVAHSHQDAAFDASVNIVGSLNILEAVKNQGLKKFLFVSSGAVYGDPKEIPTPETSEFQLTSPYALSKHTLEVYLDYFTREYGVPGVVVRPANVYGPRQVHDAEGGVVAQFSRHLLTTGTATIEGKGEQTRDFIYVGDVAAGIIAAMVKGGGVYNLSTAKDVSIRELLVEMGKVANIIPKVNYDPPRPADIKRAALSPRRAERELGWEPQVPLIEGLRLTMRWFKDNLKV